jgi:uncharacterized NAD(P)/FAD-binding protein YdhS
LGQEQAGTILAHQLVEKGSTISDAGVKVYLIEKDGNHGPGLAYSTPLTAHILNMRADTLGVINGDPLHFVKWLEGHDHISKASWEDINYPPRNVYGKYLRAVLDHAVNRACSGICSVELVKGEAIDIDQNGRAFAVKMADGGIIKADNVVLAPGNFLVLFFRS